MAKSDICYSMLVCSNLCWDYRHYDQLLTNLDGLIAHNVIVVDLTTQN